MATRPLPAKKLLRCTRGRHRADCKGDKDKRHARSPRQRCTVRGHVYRCSGPNDLRHSRSSRSDAARQREAVKRAMRSEPMDEVARQAVREGDSASRVAVRMRRYRARKLSNAKTDPVTLSAFDKYAVDSVGSVTLPTPDSCSAPEGTKPLSAFRAIPAGRLPKALQPFAGMACPCPCHGWPTTSLITEHEPYAIPAPTHPEPPERRRLIKKAKAAIRVRDAVLARQEVAVTRVPAPEPERKQFGHGSLCTEWVLTVRPGDEGYDKRCIVPSPTPQCVMPPESIQAMIPDRAAFRRTLNLPAPVEQ